MLHIRINVPNRPINDFTRRACRYKDLNTPIKLPSLPCPFTVVRMPQSDSRMRLFPSDATTLPASCCHSGATRERRISGVARSSCGSRLVCCYFFLVPLGDYAHLPGFRVRFSREIGFWIAAVGLPRICPRHRIAHSLPFHFSLITS